MEMQKYSGANVFNTVKGGEEISVSTRVSTFCHCWLELEPIKTSDYGRVIRGQIKRWFSSGTFTFLAAPTTAKDW